MSSINPAAPIAHAPGSASEPPPSSPWPETDWGQVLALRDPAAHAEALAEVCRIYHPVILRVLRRLDAANAEDLAQGFVLTLIRNHCLERADPDAGRFRHYLGKMLENFTRKQHRDGNRQKRGGAMVHLQLRDDSAVFEPEGTEIFDREWAKALMGRVVDTFKAEEAQPDLLRIALRELAHMGEDLAVDEGYAGLSQRTGTPESTLRSEVTRMRRRFQERLKQEVALTTVRSEIDGEIRYLLKALGE
jgi:DNA-directed RNA polymerase specialized sigma24 family protein